MTEANPVFETLIETPNSTDGVWSNVDVRLDVVGMKQETCNPGG